MGDASDGVDFRTNLQMFSIIDPGHRLIGHHKLGGIFSIFPVDNKGQLKEVYDLRFDQIILDIKFLYGCPKPTIVVISKDKNNVRKLTAYELSIEREGYDENTWAQSNLDDGANRLIPVSTPVGGVIVIGDKTIAYCNTKAFKSIPINMSLTRHYAEVDSFRYLLGDDVGFLHLLSIRRKKNGVRELKIKRLGKTFVADTISHLPIGLISNLRIGPVYVSSSCGNTQLIKLNMQAEANGYNNVEVLKTWHKPGVVYDICVVDHKRLGQSQVFTSRENYIDGSLCFVHNRIGINEQASEEIKGIKGLWSLRASFDDGYDSLLVLSVIGQTRILAVNAEEHCLEERDIYGFETQTETLFCHNAIHDQLIQVISNSIQLVSCTAGESVHVWKAPSGCSINVATANASQVLLAIGGRKLCYLEIEEKKLILKKYMTLDYDISCLNINPVAEDPSRSLFAAVGMWTVNSVNIYSLPDLEFITTECFEGEAIIPRSVLLCKFEGMAYLLCALGDGNLFNFQFNTNTGELSERKKVSVGTQPITLRTFCSNGITHVFAASDKPTVIHSIKKKILYCNVSLEEVTLVCPFNPASYPDSLAIAKDGCLSIGTVDIGKKLLNHQINLEYGPSRICHQEESRTFVLCTQKMCRADTEETKTELVQLLDDQTFEYKSTYQLDTYERVSRIISCSFLNDDNVYYCVGTGSEADSGGKGRILVFAVEDGKLRLITKKEFPGVVGDITPFNGKLLAARFNQIQLFKWAVNDGGSAVLELECGSDACKYPCKLKTRGNLILVNRHDGVFLLRYKDGEIEKVAELDYKPMRRLEFLDDDVFLCADYYLNLYTMCRKSNGATEEDRHQLAIVGRLQLDCGISCFHLLNSEMTGIPMVLFSTFAGRMGVIISLSKDTYELLERLQLCLDKAINNAAGYLPDQWRAFWSRPLNFVDGSLIDAFLDLSRGEMVEVANAMELPLDDLCTKVQELRINLLHLE